MPVIIEQNRTEQNRTEQNRTEQNRTEQTNYSIFQFNLPIFSTALLFQSVTRMLTTLTHPTLQVHKSTTKYNNYNSRQLFGYLLLFYNVLINRALNIILTSSARVFYQLYTGMRPVPNGYKSSFERIEYQFGSGYKKII